LNAVVREYVEGVSVKSLMVSARIFSNFSKRKQLADCFFKIGFAAGLVQNKTFNSGSTSTDKKTQVYTRIDCIKKKSNRRFGNCRPISKAINFIEHAIPTALDNEITVWTHGDFVHSNLIVPNGGGISIIDFSDLTFGSPAEDITRFMIRTMVDYRYRLFNEPKFLDYLQSNFINAYSSMQPLKVSADELKIYYLLNLLESITGLAPRNFAARLSIRDLYILFLLREAVVD
jgi:aminoglycoside phosphotransferase (APT) family kinase protein